MDSSPTDTLLASVMVIFWTIVVLVAVLGISWKVHQARRRRERREAARESRRKFHEWRQTAVPDSKH